MIGSLILVFIIFQVRAFFDESRKETAVISLKDDPIDYETAVFLDAESLSEQGIGEAYQDLESHLTKIVKEVPDITEHFQSETGSYSIEFEGNNFHIFEPGVEKKPGRSWGLATFTLFTIVNRILKDTDQKFYALYGGHDLMGIFLSDEQFRRAKQYHHNSKESPYIPRNEHPWYGQPH